MDNIGELIPTTAVEKINTALEFCRSVEVIEIHTVEQAENANTLFLQLGGYIKEVEAERVRVKEPFLQKSREVDTYFKPPQEVLGSLKSKLDLALRGYKLKLEDQRRIEQERLNREAADRQRVLDEQARVQREKEERLRTEAANAAATDAEEAARLTAQADTAARYAAINEEKRDTVVAPVAQVFTPRMTGTSVRQNWTFEVINQLTLVRHLVDEKQYHLLSPNETALKALAKTLRQPKTYPGGRIFNDEKLVGKRV